MTSDIPEIRIRELSVEKVKCGVSGVDDEGQSIRNAENWRNLLIFSVLVFEESWVAHMSQHFAKNLRRVGVVGFQISTLLCFLRLACNN